MRAQLVKDPTRYPMCWEKLKGGNTDYIVVLLILTKAFKINKCSAMQFIVFRQQAALILVFHSQNAKGD